MQIITTFYKIRVNQYIKERPRNDKVRLFKNQLFHITEIIIS